MSADLIVGFFPATAGAAKAAASAGAGASSGQAEGTPGLFGALLGMATSTEASTSLAETEPVPPAFTPDSAIEAAAVGLAGVTEPLGVAFAVKPGDDAQIDGEALLADLVDALAALNVAQANGEPPSPVLEQKLEATLDALAGLLGITLPAEPAIDPALAGAAAVPGSTTGAAPEAMDALLPFAAGQVPAVHGQSLLAPASNPVQFVVTTPPASSEAVVPTTIQPPSAPTTPVVPAAGTVPQSGATLGLPQSARTAPVATDEPAIDPTSDLGRLVGRIGELSQAIEPHSPGLAKRLDALVQKLTSGEVSGQMLAQLGIAPDQSLTDSDLDEALQQLLAGATVKGTPAPQAFAAAELKLPEIITLATKTKTAEPHLPTAAAAPPPNRPSADIATAPPLPAAPQGPEVEQKAAAPNSAADAVKLAVAKPETPLDPASGTQPPAQPAPLPTGIVPGTKAIHAAYQAPVHQINIPQVAFEVVRQVQAGNSRFQIRLDPPELGRIDVRLDMDGSGNVNARMTVERAETLDLMQRDQRALERALAQAGLDSSKTNLEFSLRQNPFGREDGGDGRGHRSPFGAGGGDLADLGEPPAEPSQTQYRGSAGAGGVNLFV